MQPELYTDYLAYDSLINQYVLTEQALMEYCAIDLRAELAATNGTAPDLQVLVFCRRVSQLVYGVMRGRVLSGSERLQDYAIDQFTEAKSILFRALCAQAYFMRYEGDLKLSMDETMRRLAIDDEVINILNETVPQLGHSLVYSGVWR